MFHYILEPSLSGVCGRRESLGRDFHTVCATRNVSEVPTRDKHEKIGPTLVFGECADDDAMLNMLRKVLEEQFPDGGSADLSRVQSLSSDPAFAGSRSMAATSWAAMNSQHEAYHVDEL